MEFISKVHAQIDVYGEDRQSWPQEPSVSELTQWIAFVGVLTLSTVIFYLAEKQPLFRPVAAKQYPGEGVVNYGFPVEDDGDQGSK